MQLGLQLEVVRMIVNNILKSLNVCLKSFFKFFPHHVRLEQYHALIIYGREFIIFSDIFYLAIAEKLPHKRQSSSNYVTFSKEQQSVSYSTKKIILETLHCIQYFNQVYIDRLHAFSQTFKFLHFSR